MSWLFKRKPASNVFLTPRWLAVELCRQVSNALGASIEPPDIRRPFMEPIYRRVVLWTDADNFHIIEPADAVGELLPFHFNQVELMALATASLDDARQALGEIAKMAAQQAATSE